MSIDQGQIVCFVGANTTTIKNITKAKASARSMEYLVLFEIFSISFESYQSRTGFLRSIKMLVIIWPREIIATAIVQRRLCTNEISVKIAVNIMVTINEEYVNIRLKTILAFICLRGEVGAIFVM